MTNQFLEALASWKEICGRLTPDQRAKLNASFTPPIGNRLLRFNDHLQSPVVPVARRVNAGFEIEPTRVLTRASGDIHWQNGQEHGPISPRQFIKTGEAIEVENPYHSQPLQFILHVLPEFDFNAESLAAEFAPVTQRKTPADVFTDEKEGMKSSNVPPKNLRLMPPLQEEIRNGGNTIATLRNGALALTAENPGDEPRRETKQLPSWSLNADLSSRRGLGMWVTGDESGALLLVQVGSRDYVVSIDFKGRRYIEIPNGEVSWANGDWGWRMDTKTNNYAKVHQVKIGFGQLPAHSSATVTVEQLTALGEVSKPLVNPVVNTGIGWIRLHGSVPCGYFLQYVGGRKATVYDENWRAQGELDVETSAPDAPHGSLHIQVAADGDGRWLDTQFITVGDPMHVGSE